MSRLRPLVRLYLLWVYRKAALRRPLEAASYLVRGREVTNFTYEISNADELIDMLAVALEEPRERIAAYAAELASDRPFLDELGRALRARRDRANQPMFGRRLGWYCVVRHAKPRLVVETGSHDGLGTALLLRALERNAAEGSEGTLVSADIDPGSGWLVPESLRSRLERHIGDARETLPVALSGRRVDVFIHDSLHTYEHERFELELALEHAGEPVYLISDNAHASTALADLCHQRGLRYLHFVERPTRHFYPGAALGLGIGIARR
jgi:hypothetical protein